MCHRIRNAVTHTHFIAVAREVWAVRNPNLWKQLLTPLGLVTRRGEASLFAWWHVEVPATRWILVHTHPQQPCLVALRDSAPAVAPGRSWGGPSSVLVPECSRDTVNSGGHGHGALGQWEALSAQSGPPPGRWGVFPTARHQWVTRLRREELELKSGSLSPENKQCMFQEGSRS